MPPLLQGELKCSLEIGFCVDTTEVCVSFASEMESSRLTCLSKEKSLCLSRWFLTTNKNALTVIVILNVASHLVDLDPFLCTQTVDLQVLDKCC